MRSFNASRSVVEDIPSWPSCSSDRTEAPVQKGHAPDQAACSLHALSFCEPVLGLVSAASWPFAANAAKREISTSIVSHNSAILVPHQTAGNFRHRSGTTKALKAKHLLGPQERTQKRCTWLEVDPPGNLHGPWAVIGSCRYSESCCLR